MAKHVFRPSEIINLSRKVFIQPPAPVEEEPEELEAATDEEYEGPTVEDFRREAEVFKVEWEKEKAEMISKPTRKRRESSKKPSRWPSMRSRTKTIRPKR